MPKSWTFRSAVFLAGLTLVGCSASSEDRNKDSAGSVSTDQLAGINRSQLIALLGPADFHRKDGVAEIMQYRNSSCILDVFLYAKAGAAEPQVHHVEARDQRLQPVSGENCLSTVLQSRRT